VAQRPKEMVQAPHIITWGEGAGGFPKRTKRIEINRMAVGELVFLLIVGELCSVLVL
jgi:hypothetical protein